ncbi:hypothetical protein AcV7_008279 [Taiwanofungus camphoratus]|nr:hypothetical protein AcV7_008279 [Antrodia cinnamomea]
MHVFCLWTLLAAVSTAAVATSSSTGNAPFAYNNETFLLHGKPYQIIGGQMDPQRIPKPYWRDRLAKARAMGLNTVFSYVFWDQVETTPGVWDFTGNNDVAEYFAIAQEEGLNIVLRAGPYICGEHDWGGLPYWLSNVPGMDVRANNAPFLNASKSYIDRLSTELWPLFVTRGGPILLVQLENEYGSFGADHTYMAALRDIFEQAFDVPLYTNDGGGQHYLAGGQVHGVLAEIDGAPQVGFAARQEYVTDPTSLGPLLDGEYYVTWLSTWGSNSTYQTDVGVPSLIEGVQSDLNWILTNNASFSIYMFHGGTNWGFQNGGVWSSALTPVTTSYDYGAPLDESGRTTDAYYAIRETISAFVSPNSILPVPEQSAPIEFAPVELTPVVAMFEALPAPVTRVIPSNMETLGQAHGFILYRTTVKTPVQGILSPGDAPRDRVLVYVNGNRTGVIDNIYPSPATVYLTLGEGDVLDLLVENMGRVDYGPRLVDQRKGIVGNVTVGGSVILDWEMYPLSLDEPPKPSAQPPSAALPYSLPMFYSGSFSVDLVGDTFLELTGWIKGVVWVNGINIGRYWIVGPQQTLYLPGCYLREGSNDIVVLNLEPTVNATAVSGISSRNWGNNPDPDAP